MFISCYTTYGYISILHQQHQILLVFGGVAWDSAYKNTHATTRQEYAMQQSHEKFSS